LEEGTKQEFKQRCKAYFQKLEDLRLEDAMLSRRQNLNFSQKLVLYLGAIPALAGWIAGALPLNIARQLRAKLVYKAKDQHFWAPIAMVLSLVSWIGYMALLSLGTAYWLGFWSLALAPLAALLQFWQIQHADYVLAWQRESRLRQFEGHAASELESLKAERARLFEKLGEME
jgi:hypothetical protein